MNPIRTTRALASAVLSLAGALAGAEACLAAGAPSSAPPVHVDPPKPIPAPVEPYAMPLYAGVAPGSEHATQQEAWESFLGQRIVRNVVRPELLPVRPTGTGNGRAVIVVPGGGYRFLSMDTEGYSVARRLAEHGYAAFVLKYRTEPTPAAPAEFFATTAAAFATMGKAALQDHPPAVADLATAVQRVQRDAKRWRVDPSKVGVVGFSAGARSVVRLVEQHSADAKPANVALIYPPMEAPVSGGARPPMFLAIAVDDPLFAQGGLRLLEAWLAESRAVEFHLYSGGSHGFGARRQGTTSDGWIDAYLRWLDVQK